MNWIRINIITNSAGIDRILYELGELGIDSVEIADKEDFRAFLKNNRKYWDYVDEELEKLKTADTRITAYVSDDVCGEDMVGKVKEMTVRLKSENDEALGSLAVLTAKVKDEDWSENWKQYFHPIEVGERVLIQPQWEPLDRETDRVVFKVNPGLTFGTGSHDSTRFCIEEIERYLSPGDTMLDLGCGSGILSIIALLLGASRCDAADIDPNSEQVAYDNLSLNGIDKSRYTVRTGDILTDSSMRGAFGQYDIVAANIVADVIIELSRFVLDFMKPDAVFICSGIINERAGEVKAALEGAGLRIINKKQSAEWTAFACKRA
ncbi:MAG TPA: 50S ribosomal protein L11 methyltransferase [Candidatus Monoglobus merdigallinarum]|uniref:Ribosomal protein L11 methyltransferase n=1 Tax=Candidatus Monoglobus merdigallinarum TaxID=2838698 RepID=A0A9D1PQ03_9FIRM|nr:50S ribosomal protein L11 methyltransferase [Candidatus Monoglobus merdigallinarum]